MSNQLIFAVHNYIIIINENVIEYVSSVTVDLSDNKADFTYTAKNGNNTVTGSFSQIGLTLPTAEGKAFNDAALMGETAITLGGILADTTANLAVVGTVTVAISKS